MGVRLRKRMNQTAYHQKIDVYVDDKFAGTWFEQGSNYVDNYDEADYKKTDRRKIRGNRHRNPDLAKRKDARIVPRHDLRPSRRPHAGEATSEPPLRDKNSLAVSAPDAGLTNEYYYWVYSYARTP